MSEKEKYTAKIRAFLFPLTLTTFICVTSLALTFVPYTQVVIPVTVTLAFFKGFLFALNASYIGIA